MAQNKLKLEILTPQRRILNTEAEWVTIPGEEGELGILPEHLPLVTTVGSGILRYAAEGRSHVLAVHYGYMSLRGDAITVLSEMVERAEDIDVERARRSEQRSREELQHLLQTHDDDAGYRLSKLEAKVKRALVRQQAHG